MSCEEEKRKRRASPFPSQMQGSWVGQEEPEFGIVIDGAEIVWNALAFEYTDKFEEIYEDGAVRIEIQVPHRIDSGDDINLVASAEGELHVFSAHFAITLVRAEPDSRAPAHI